MIYFVYDKTTGNLITTVSYVDDLKHFIPNLVDIVIY